MCICMYLSRVYMYILWICIDVIRTFTRISHDAYIYVQSGIRKYICIYIIYIRIMQFLDLMLTPIYIYTYI